MLSRIKPVIKRATSILIGLSGLYPLARFAMFLLAPTIGREPAHHHIITKILIYLGNGGLLLGLAILLIHIFGNAFSEARSIEGEQ